MTVIPFDLVVLGAGPAGEKGAVAAAMFGARVALVERRSQIGGAVANTGTLPSKTLRETALALSGLRARRLYGVDLSLRREATIADLMYHEHQVAQSTRVGALERLDYCGVETFYGVGSFVDSNTIRIAHDDGDETLLRARRVLIATGSAPSHPAGIAFGSAIVHDSDEILQIDRLPKRLVVVGAGVIGSEYACTFAALGVEVVLVDGRETLLPFMDSEISAALTTAMTHLGIRFVRPTRVDHCEVLSETLVRVVLESGETIETDGVLFAAGRNPRTADLNLDAVGIAVGDRGLITVNAHYQTSVAHVYAAGDVIGFPALASTSMEQARVAMCHAFDRPVKKELASILPTGIYTIPEASMVGATEEQLRAAGTPYIVGRAKYQANARGQIIGDEHGLLKLLFAHDDMRLLGVHVLGEQASEVVHVGMMVMLSGGGAEVLINACFNFPTLGDMYKTATYDAVRKRYELHPNGGLEL